MIKRMYIKCQYIKIPKIKNVILQAAACKMTKTIYPLSEAALAGESKGYLAHFRLSNEQPHRKRCGIRLR